MVSVHYQFLPYFVHWEKIWSNFDLFRLRFLNWIFIIRSFFFFFRVLTRQKNISFQTGPGTHQLLGLQRWSQTASCNHNISLHILHFFLSLKRKDHKSSGLPDLCAGWVADWKPTVCWPSDLNYFQKCIRWKVDKHDRQWQLGQI